MPSLGFTTFVQQMPGIVSGLLLIEIADSFGVSVGLMGQMRTTAVSLGILMALISRRCTYGLSTISNSVPTAFLTIRLNKVESRRIMDKLQRKYPKKEEWTAQSKEGKDKKKPGFIVERRNSDNLIERVVVDVKPVKRISGKNVKRLNIFARNMAGGRSHILGKVFAVPSGANVENVPENFTVIFYEPELVALEAPMVEAVMVEPA